MRVESSRASSPYRGSGTPGQPRYVWLDDLTPAARARLAAASRSRGARWLLREVAPGWLPVPGWLAATVVVGLALLSSQAFASWRPWLTAFALTETCLCLTLTALQWQLLALLAVVLARAERHAPALRPGLYLFARHLIDARSDPIVLHPTDALARVHRRGDRLVLTFQDGAQHELTSPLPPDALCRQLDALRQQASRAEAAGDLPARLRLDPIVEQRPVRVASGHSILRHLRRAARLVLAPAAVLAASVVGARLAAIELAAAQGDVPQLIRFAQGDRLTGPWADRRWAPLALAPGREDLHAQYLRLGADRGGFARQLAARLETCGPALSEPCLAIVRALRATNRIHGETADRVHHLLGRDPAARFELFDQGLDVVPWPTHDLRVRALTEAVERRDLRRVRLLAREDDLAHQTDEALARLNREAIGDLQGRQTRTRFVLEQALLYVTQHDVDLELNASSDAAHQGQHTPTLTRPLIAAINRQPYGQVLRLTDRSSLLDWSCMALLTSETKHSRFPADERRNKRVHARLQVHLETSGSAPDTPVVDAVRWRLSLHDGSYTKIQCGEAHYAGLDAERRRLLLDATGEPLPWDVDTETTQRLDPPLPWPRPAAPTDDDLQALLDRLL